MSKNKNSVDFALPLSRQEYSEVFKTYKNISNEYVAMLMWIQNKLLTEIPKKDRYSILSVGSGAGDFDSQLIKVLKNEFGFIEYVVVEPYDTYCQQFKTLLDSHSFNDFQYEIYPILFENFNSSKFFDLIHFTHSLYYIHNRGQAILYALNMLADDGRILIFNQTSKGINQIQRKFLKRVRGNTDYMFSSKDLEKILNHYNIPYRLDIIDSFLDVTDLYSKDSEYVPNLLNFFLESKVSILAPTIVSEILDYIKSISFCDGGRRFMFHPVAIFSIFKKEL